MERFRVECNFGSKYFDEAVDAFAYFEKCKKKNRNVGIWVISLCYIKKTKRFSASQELLDYSFTTFS